MWKEIEIWWFMALISVCLMGVAFQCNQMTKPAAKFEVGSVVMIDGKTEGTIASSEWKWTKWVYRVRYKNIFKNLKDAKVDEGQLTLAEPKPTRIFGKDKNEKCSNFPLEHRRKS